MRFQLPYILISLIPMISIAKVEPACIGDWILVNGVLILSIDEDGSMVLRNTGATGPVEIAEDGSFRWSAPDGTKNGCFKDGRLLLKNNQEGTPAWMHYLEFRRGSKKEVHEVIEYALRQQNQIVNADEKIRTSAIEKGILNNLRTIAAAADQYYLEKGVGKVSLDQLVGPGKFIHTLKSVDGEDYSVLNLTKKTESLEVKTASGIKVSYSLK